jgi:hypothetical protein
MAEIIPINAAASDPRPLVELLYRNGYIAVPLKSGTREPAYTDWQEGVPRGHWKPDHGIGVACGDGFVCIDLDSDEVEVIDAIMGALPTAIVRSRGSKGLKCYFRDPARMLQGCSIKDVEGKELCRVITNGLAVVPPTLHHRTGQPHVWLGGCTLFNTRFEQLFPLPADTKEKLREALAPWAKPKLQPKPHVEAQPTVFLTRELDKRHRGRSQAALIGEQTELAKVAKGGRTNAVFAAGCKLAPYTAHGYLKAKTVEAVLLEACRENGLLRDRGEEHCLREVRNGLAKAADEPLPDLPDRVRQPGPPNSGEGSAEQPSKRVEVTETTTVWRAHRTLAAHVIASTKVAWWPYLVLGEINIIGGRGGEGKGVIASDIAARITQGAAWPTDQERAPRGRVLWFEAEDDLDKTVLPRLVACGADLDLIEAYKPADFPGWSAVRTYIEAADVRLIVINPLIQFFKGLADINSEIKVRLALEELQAAIQGQACMGLGICHLNKKPDLDALERLLGASAFANVARSVLFLHREPSEEGEGEALVRRIVHRKFNLTTKGTDLLFTIEHTNPQRPRDQFLRPTWWPADKNVDDAALYQREGGKAGKTGRMSAGTWLYNWLRDNGPAARVDVIRAAVDANYKEKTVQEAFVRGSKEGLFEAVRVGEFQGGTMWTLSKVPTPRAVSAAFCKPAGTGDEAKS